MNRRAAMAEGKQLRRTMDILLVEDNPADALLMEEALRDSSTTSRLQTVIDGDDALDFLFQRGAYRDRPRPDLILLDLNLPKKDGREVLAEIKSDPHLRSIPVVVVTTSKSEEDIFKSYSLHANCYITKPVRLSDFFDIVRKIEDFWFETVRLPSQEKRY